VTHDQEEALTMSDRIAVMSEGVVEQIGTPEEIYGSPASVFVAGFIGVANLMPASVERVNGTDAEVTLPGGSRVSVSITSAPPQVGTTATVMVRPERIHVQMEEPAGDVSRVRTTVIDLTFQGALVRAELVCADGTVVVAHVGPDDDLPMLRPNDVVWLTWEGDAARLLPALDTTHGRKSELEELEASQLERSLERVDLPLQ